MQFQMDIGSVMPMLKAQSRSGEVAKHEDGHWYSENSYDIPGGQVDTTKETSVESGEGWHSHATKQTSFMKQEFAGADVQPNAGNKPTFCVIVYDKYLN